MGTKKMKLSISDCLNEAKGARMTLMQQRLYLMMLAKIGPRKREGSASAVFSAKEFQEAFGILAWLVNAKWLEESINESLNGMLGIEAEVETEKGAVFVRILESFRLSASAQWLEVLMECPPEAMKALSLKGGRTEYPLSCVAGLGSPEAIRLYGLLKQRQKAGEGKWAVEICDLEAMMGFFPKSFKNFNCFKNGVLRPCQKEICEKTDIGFVWQSRRVQSGKPKEAVFSISAMRPQRGKKA